MLPLPATMLWLVIHTLIASSLSWLIALTGWVSAAEVLVVYFIILAMRNYDYQVKFIKALKDNPEVMFSVLRQLYVTKKEEEK